MTGELDEDFGPSEYGPSVGWADVEAVGEELRSPVQVVVCFLSTNSVCLGLSLVSYSTCTLMSVTLSHYSVGAVKRTDHSPSIHPSYELYPACFFRLLPPARYGLSSGSTDKSSRVAFDMELSL